MSGEDYPGLLPPRATRLLGWSAVGMLLALGIFTYPLSPSTDLDPSWRMALGYFFQQGSQFGTEVVFTYGPLGFIMGKTYSGLQFWSLLAGQGALAVVSALVLTRQVWRARGYARVLSLLFVFLFGIIYEDALHMLVIAALGFEALRMMDLRQTGRLAICAAILAGFSEIKFTNLMLSLAAVMAVTGYGISRRWWREAAVMGGMYVSVYLAIWLACGQSLLNLPAYLANSWEISQGYQWAMGFPAPALQLGLGLIVLTLLVAYGAAHWVLHAEKRRATANVLLLAAFVYLNWKHGFIRPDGHLIGFFICAMLPLAAYPGLLDDGPRFSRLHRWCFLGGILLSLGAMEVTLDGIVKGALGTCQNRIWNNVTLTLNWNGTRQRYSDDLARAREATALRRVRGVVGQGTIDVLGSEQGVALFNSFNYHQRPVFQGYSVFTPKLAQLNVGFFKSGAAPDYVLLKVQSIDLRLPMMDDPEVLQLLVHRYEYLFSEGKYLLWKRKPGAFDAAVSARTPLLTRTGSVAEPLPLDAYSDQPLWLRIDLPPSLLGRLRAFFYRPPQVKLKITLSNGDQTEYLMPLPQGREGFVINPLVEDYVDYLQFASNTFMKHVASVSLELAPGDGIYFAPTVRYELSALRPGGAARGYIPKDTAKIFYMFRSYPVAYEAAVDVNVGQVGEKSVALLHAPSQMIFEVPPHSTALSGQFGFLVGAYTNGGHTNGAQFLIYWSDGTRRIDLFQRFLDPVTVDNDRGLQDFKVELKNLPSGRIYFETNPGPYNNNAWDWTGWTNISFSR